MNRLDLVHHRFMGQALGLARRAYGRTSPNPMVGALLVRSGRVLGRGWHHQAGRSHAEVEAIRDASARGCATKGATLYVTLEPCSTQGRTPPCTAAILAAGIKRVVVGATDPNPAHSGRAFDLLRRAGIEVTPGVRSEEAARLNEAFNHWIVHQTPWVTVKAAMTLDGKIATRSGESRWITGEQSRAWAMHLRQGADAVLVGINTVLADDPALTVRPAPDRTKPEPTGLPADRPDDIARPKRRIILDSRARTPLSAKVVTDEFAGQTTVVVTRAAPEKRVLALRRRVEVWVAPGNKARIALPWLLRRLGRQQVTHLLVEGGGEVNASFLLGRLTQRVVFFFAPKILGGHGARKAVAGDGATSLATALELRDLKWRHLGPDLMLTALV